MNPIDIILMILYFLILLGIGYFNSRKETAEGFLIADRNVKWPYLIATLSSGVVGGGALIVLASWAFQFGLSVIWIFFGSSLGFLALISISKRLKKLADKKKFYTISDYIYLVFGRRTGFLGTIIVFLYFLFWLLLQFIGGGIILSSLLGINYAYAVLIMGGTILIYLALSGFKAVVKTDLFQFLIMILLGIVIFKISFGGISFTPEHLNVLSGTGGTFGIISFLVIGLLLITLSGDVWQRMYSAKTQRDLKIGLIGAATSVIIIGAIISSIGFWAKANFPGIVPEDAFVYGIQNILPAALLSVGLLVILSTIMSTADSILFAMSMNISRDFLFHFKKLSKDSLVNITRMFIFVLVIASVIVSLITTRISNIALMSASVIFPLGPAVLGSFRFKIKKNAAFFSILAGFAAFLGLVLFYTIDEITVVIPFLASLAVLIIGQIVFKK